MWLVDTTTLQLHEFDSDVPDYAILSHRWSHDETSFKDFRKGRDKDSAGYKKVADFCTIVRRQRIPYAWIDTCCIDKRSSAELSEAINSMYSWYQKAQICYAYLADVAAEFYDLPYGDIVEGEELELPWTMSPGGSGLYDQLRESVWFVRGWTLQELLAPLKVVFFSREWRRIGASGCGPANDNTGPRYHRLEPLISEITRIPAALLEGTRHVTNYSVAQKMSWLSRRSTTRDEDIAYCALGLFDIHMPLLYGEGMHAWFRLQEQIVQKSSDESIFAWSDDYDYDYESSLNPQELQEMHLMDRPPRRLEHDHKIGRTAGHSILAPHHSFFEYCRYIKHRPRKGDPMYGVKRFTNEGLELRLQAGTVALAQDKFRVEWSGKPMSTLIVPLTCTTADAEGEPDRCVLQLQRRRCGHFERIHISQTTLASGDIADLFDQYRTRVDMTIYVHATPDTKISCDALNALDDVSESREARPGASWRSTADDARAGAERQYPARVIRGHIADPNESCELTIDEGHIVMVSDLSMRSWHVTWWRVANGSGETGYVPSECLLLV